jgi:hypothetical protein
MSKLHYIAWVKLWHSAFIASFNRKLRDECLNKNVFRKLDLAGDILNR